MEENNNVEEIKKAEEANNVVNLSEEKIQNLQRELEDKGDRLKRLMAEFDNFKKRSLKERETLYKSVISDIVIPLLPIIDNLEKAVSAETTDVSYKTGIELVLKQFLDVLGSMNVKPIKSVGEVFDPELHEAVSNVQDDTLGEKIIKEEYRKGYTIGDKVIRHSMVIVAN